MENQNKAIFGFDPKMTSPYKFYYFWLNADDVDLRLSFQFFSLRTREDIEQLESQIMLKIREMLKKVIGGDELTVERHSEIDCQNVQMATELLFEKPETNFKISQRLSFELISQEIPSIKMAKNLC